MNRWILLALVALLVPSFALAQQPNVQVQVTSPFPQHFYNGNHPVPYYAGGGFCYIGGKHTHFFKPLYSEFYRQADQTYNFIGDPMYHGFVGKLYYYKGRHQLPTDRAGGYCRIQDPHRHHFKPTSGHRHFRVVRGYYTYSGTLPPMQSASGVISLRRYYRSPVYASLHVRYGYYPSVPYYQVRMTHYPRYWVPIVRVQHRIRPVVGVRYHYSPYTVIHRRRTYYRPRRVIYRGPRTTVIRGPGYRPTVIHRGPGHRRTVIHRGPRHRTTVIHRGPTHRKTVILRGPRHRTTVIHRGPGHRKTVIHRGPRHRTTVIHRKGPRRNVIIHRKGPRHRTTVIHRRGPRRNVIIHRKGPRRNVIIHRRGPRHRTTVIHRGPRKIKYKHRKHRRHHRKHHRRRR